VAADGKLFGGRFTSQAVVEIAPNIDFSKLHLDSEEAFVLSRIGGGLKAGELIAGSGLTEAKVDSVLGSLADKGCVIERGQPSTPARPSTASTAVPSALPPEKQREIVEMEERLKSLDPFAALGVTRGSSAADCRTAYYDLSMRFHPDRFYGKELGSFKPRLEAIFRRLADAKNQVTDPDKRSALEREHPEWFRPAPGSSATNSSSQARPTSSEGVRDLLRADDRARRLANHPYLHKINRVREQLLKARKAFADDNPGLAMSEVQVALSADPNNVEANALLKDIQALMIEHRAKTALAEGLKHLGNSDSKRALFCFLEALEAGPTVQGCEKGLDAAFREENWRAAKNLATKWVELEPRSPKARLGLATALFRAGLVKNAKREAEEVIKLDPANKAAKAMLDKLRSL
jgi:curved DNA-binding protein CbpA